MESRKRGGSRPGLAKVLANVFADGITGLYAANIASIDGSTNKKVFFVLCNGTIFYLYGNDVVEAECCLTTDTGEAILTEDNEKIIFGNTISATNPLLDVGGFGLAMQGNKLYIADSYLTSFDPNTGVVDVISSAPASQPVIASYRDRIFLAGSTHIWYASRTGNPLDFSLVDNYKDESRAMAGQLGRAGELGSVVKAMVPHENQHLVMATASSLHSLSGEPTTGRLARISDQVGIISPWAWAKGPGGLLAFVSGDGIYLWQIGSSSAPARFSEERVPAELREIDTTTNIVQMAYDARFQGFHLFVTPSSGTGTHWWLDLKSKAMWPVILPSIMQPKALCSMVGDNALSDVVLGCGDGYLRKFSTAATTDDGTNFQSHVTLGPIRISGSDSIEAMLKEISSVFADMETTITWRLFVGKGAEIVADQAVAATISLLASEDPVDVKASGSWVTGWNRVVRPRKRGTWCAVLLSSTGQWSYESVAFLTQVLGRPRSGY